MVRGYRDRDAVAVDPRRLHLIDGAERAPAAGPSLRPAGREREEGGGRTGHAMTKIRAHRVPFPAHEEPSDRTLRALPMSRRIPALIGVIHLRPLPESPRFDGSLAAVIAAAASDARLLVDAGFEGIVVENFGDAPFMPGRVSPVTVASMTAAALAVRTEAKDTALGINVLRN